VLLDPLAGFPFETPHHRAALVADVVALTLTGRRFSVR